MVFSDQQFGNEYSHTTEGGEHSVAADVQDPSNWTAA